jgi:hypothetical protein
MVYAASACFYGYDFLITCHSEKCQQHRHHHGHRDGEFEKIRHGIEDEQKNRCKADLIVHHQIGDFENLSQKKNQGQKK